MAMLRESSLMFVQLSPDERTNLISAVSLTKFGGALETQSI